MSELLLAIGRAQWWNGEPCRITPRRTRDYHDYYATFISGLLRLQLAHLEVGAVARASDEVAPGGDAYNHGLACGWVEEGNGIADEDSGCTAAEGKDSLAFEPLIYRELLEGTEDCDTYCVGVVVVRRKAGRIAVQRASVAFVIGRSPDASSLEAHGSGLDTHSEAVMQYSFVVVLEHTSVFEE